MKNSFKVFCGLIYLALAFSIISGCEGEKTKKKGYTAKDYFSKTLDAELAEAAREGDAKRIDELIAQGSDVNAVGKEGYTPLMYAMTRGRTEGFQHLLEKGANPNLQALNGDSAVSFAASRQDSEYLKIVLAHKGDPNIVAKPDKSLKFTISEPTPIYRTIFARNPANASLLVKAGADYEYRNCYGSTPLMAACNQNSYEVMYVLLEAGADLKQPMN